MQQGPVAPASYSEFIEKWMKVYVKTNNKFSEQRSKAYKLKRHILPFFGRDSLREITELRLETFKALKKESGLSAKSINNLLTVVNKSLCIAQEWRFISRVPKVHWLRVAPPKTDFLTTEESAQLLRSAANEPLWHGMILCALRTGLRFGELIGLQWEDVDLDRKMIHVKRSVVYGVEDSPKNNRTRAVPMCQDLVDYLSLQNRDTGRVFTLSKGGPITHGIGRYALEKACRNAKLRQIGWHALRHSFASQLTMKAIPMRVIQELLGHSTISMAVRYSHLGPSTLHEAVRTLGTSRPA